MIERQVKDNIFFKQDNNIGGAAPSLLRLRVNDYSAAPAEAILSVDNGSAAPAVSILGVDGMSATPAASILRIDGGCAGLGVMELRIFENQVLSFPGLIKFKLMKRSKFILSIALASPGAAFSNFKSFFKRGKKGFKTASGESRNGEHLKMKGITLNTLDLKVSGKDTDGDLSIFEQTGTTPNGGPPLHIHFLQDEIFYVIEGKYNFQVGEDKYQLTSGDTIFLPRGVKHAFIQMSEKGRLIITYQPSGKIEAFFKFTSLWTSPPSKQEIAKAFEDHDMKVVGPPLKIEDSQ